MFLNVCPPVRKTFQQRDRNRMNYPPVQSPNAFYSHFQKTTCGNSLFSWPLSTRGFKFRTRSIMTYFMCPEGPYNILVRQSDYFSSQGIVMGAFMCFQGWQEFLCIWSDFLLCSYVILPVGTNPGIYPNSWYSCSIFLCRIVCIWTS